MLAAKRLRMLLLQAKGESARDQPLRRTAYPSARNHTTKGKRSLTDCRLVSHR